MPMEPLTPIEIKMQPGKTYYYRLTTSFMDQMNHGKGKEKLWTRNVGILFTGKTREHFHFQILCFRTEVKWEKAIPQYLITIAMIFFSCSGVSYSYLLK